MTRMHFLWTLTLGVLVLLFGAGQAQAAFVALVPTASSSVSHSYDVILDTEGSGVGAFDAFMSVVEVGCPGCIVAVTATDSTSAATGMFSSFSAAGTSVHYGGFSLTGLDVGPFAGVVIGTITVDHIDTSTGEIHILVGPDPPSSFISQFGQLPNTSCPDNSGCPLAIISFGSIPPQPSVGATKTAALLDDVDGDGQVDPGDTVEYTVVITNSGLADARGVLFTDTPGANSTLADNVTTTQGVVNSGNSGGDLTVEVDVGTLPSGGGSAIIGFHVVVDDPFPDSEDSISNQGTVSGTNFGNEISDDPDTPAPDDPTVTPVSNALDRCLDDLGTCEGDLGTCAADLGMCEGDLGTCETDLMACQTNPPFADADGDGEHDDTDACPGTPSGEQVDAAGCSLGQFCANLPVPAACNNGDWRNDEPLGNARDCKAKQGSCLPR